MRAGVASPVAESQQVLARLLVGRIPEQLAGENAEWSPWLELAGNEAVGPLLDRVLASRPELEVPLSVRHTLASMSLVATRESQIRQSECERLCRYLGERGIPVLLLKGAALALTCYEDPVTRPMSDLDLLIPPARKEDAASCLEAAGFQPRSGSGPAELQSERAHLVYHHPVSRVVVEIHWELKLFGPVQAQSTAEIWAGARPVGGAGNALVMRLGHLLPLLCVHMLLQHRRPRLIWLYDLDRVLRKMDAAEANLARDAAARWGVAACTALAVLEAVRLFGTPLPAELADWAARAATRPGLQRWVSAQVLARRGETLRHWFVDLLLGRSCSRRRLLLPTPHDVRRLLDLGADAPVGPAAYAVLLTGRLRAGARYFGELWRFCRARPHSHAAGATAPPPPKGESS